MNMINEAIDWVKNVRYRKRGEYQGCFCDQLGNLTYNGRKVLKDLMKFCNVNRSTAYANRITGNIDPIAMGIAEGRREVFNRIQFYLRLTDDEIFTILKEEDNYE